MLVKCIQNYPRGPAARIPLQNNLFALIDPDWFDQLIWYHWYAKKSFCLFYVCRKVTENGRVWFVRMHRVVADTPPELICHHINGNTFDNRRANLLNMSWFDHSKLHSWR